MTLLLALGPRVRRANIWGPFGGRPSTSARSTIEPLPADVAEQIDAVVTEAEERGRIH